MSYNEVENFINSNNIDFLDIQAVNIFPTTVFSCIPENIDNNKIMKECIDFSNSNKSVSKSNFGGWQSETLSFQNYDKFSNDLENVFDLAYKAICFSNIVSDHLGSECKFNENSVFFWININGFGDYNVLHCHPKTDLICLYYPKIKENQGSFVMLRNDSSVQNNFYSGIENGTTFEINPEKGTFYVFPAHLYHFVTANMTNEKRISISFNMSGYIE